MNTVGQSLLAAALLLSSSWPAAAAPAKPAAKTSVTIRHILHAMWLFTEKFQRALAKYEEVKGEKELGR